MCNSFKLSDLKLISLPGDFQDTYVNIVENGVFRGDAFMYLWGHLSGEGP